MIILNDAFHPHTAKSGRVGFTLVEMVMSMVIMMTLMAGIGSAIMVASRALDNGNTPSAESASALLAINQVTEDLTFALSFTERTATSAEFTVPDRTGDLVPETIRYAWSGVAGQPLTREFNGGAPVNVIAKVDDFDMNYLLRTVGPPTEGCCYEGGACADELASSCLANGGIPQGEGVKCAAVTCPTLVESDEVTLAFHDDAVGGTMTDFSVTSTAWPGTYFLPTLPTNTVSWKITRIQVRAYKSGSGNGVVSFEVRIAGVDELPTTQVLDQASLAESSLSTGYTWTNLSFSSLDGLDPTQAMSLVAKYGSGSTTVMVIEYENGDNPMTADAHFVRTSNSGGAWQAESISDLRFYVYGTYTTDGLPVWP
jgi:type II secretory pathway pseudopilin PulG